MNINEKIGHMAGAERSITSLIADATEDNINAQQQRALLQRLHAMNGKLHDLIALLEAGDAEIVEREIELLIMDEEP